MQHRKLKRDVEIAVVDAQDDLQKQRLLPFGRLRDLPERLRYVDAVILHNAKEEWPNLKAFTDAPVIATRMVVNKDIATGLGGKKIAYFCGIGRPERFEETLLSLGATIVAKYQLRDHAAISSKQLAQFCKEAKGQGAETVVCTQKDFVKLPQISLELPLQVVQAEAMVVGGKEAWDRLLKSITQKIQQRKQTS
jgi:tetraacyldisaccharide 4'-kinase